MLLYRGSMPEGLSPALAADAEAVRERLQAAVASLLALLGLGEDPIQSRESILLQNSLVGDGAGIGEDCYLYPHVVVGRACVLGDRVIVPTPDGHSLGTVVSNPQRLDEEYVKTTFRAVVRRATPGDEERVLRHQEQEREAYRYCVGAIARLQLPMKLVEVEYLFEGGKAVTSTSPPRGGWISPSS